MEPTDAPNDAVHGEGDAGGSGVGKVEMGDSTERNADRENSRERRTESEAPPDDDCCPICFGSFTVACRTNCGHWYCGSCILQFWNYSAASKPCKCPMCSRYISKLTPEASLQEKQEQEVKEVLANVQRYNRLFVGGVLGVLQKLREFPFFMKRILREMMDPDRPDSYLNEMRLFAMVLSVLYAATPFDFIPTGGLGIVRVFDYSAVATVLILRLIGLCRRRRLTRQVRRMAAAEPLHD